MTEQQRPDEDVEGHGRRAQQDLEGLPEDAEDDVEGHRSRVMQSDTGDDDVEGHSPGRRPL